jgi:hypothetical protein
MSRSRLSAWLAAISLFLSAVFLSASAGLSFFRLAVTGESVTVAANKFLSTLDAGQRAKAALAFDDKARTDWHFIPKPDGAREGVKVRDMNDQQRQAAYELLQAALSDVGYSKARQIMALEGLLHELEKSKGGKQVRDPERYFFSIYGKPTKDGQWSFSVEGHHLSLNFVIDKESVTSSTPSAFCANPAIVKNDALPSIKKGTRVLAKEETLAIDLVNSLTADQRKEAVFAEKPPGEVHNAGQPQPATDLPKGISTAKLSGEQRSTLRSLIDAYIANFPPDVAKQRTEAVEKDGPEKTSFAWAGSTKEGEGRYYCVQGPSFQIEFVNVKADSAGNPANHIHSVWRNMRGDFGLPR